MLMVPLSIKVYDLCVCGGCNKQKTYNEDWSSLCKIAEIMMQ